MCKQGYDIRLRRKSSFFSMDPLRLNLYRQVFTIFNLFIIRLKKFSLFLQLVKVALVVLFHLRSLASVKLIARSLYFICINACECLLLPATYTPTLRLKDFGLVNKLKESLRVNN
jgi:hypothetical protein